MYRGKAGLSFAAAAVGAAAAAAAAVGAAAGALVGAAVAALAGALVGRAVGPAVGTLGAGEVHAAIRPGRSSAPPAVARIKSRRLSPSPAMPEKPREWIWLPKGTRSRCVSLAHFE